MWQEMLVSWGEEQVQGAQNQGLCFGPVCTADQGSRLSCQAGRWWSSFRLEEDVERHHLLNTMHGCRTGRGQRGRDVVQDRAGDRPSSRGGPSLGGGEGPDSEQ